MILICATVVLVAAAAGCGDDQGSGAIVATTAIAADITREVAGSDADVEQLLPGSASPHDYSPSAKERGDLENAALVVAWGSGLEEGLPLEGLPVHELAHRREDPHVWMDPLLVARALPDLADELAGADSEHSDAYERRATAYARRLRDLDAQLTEILERVPPKRRKLVTMHNSLTYFADRYGFDVVGAPFASAPESEPSAAAVSRLVDTIRSENIAAVFAEHGEDAELMRRIADQSGAELVEGLLVESYGDEVESYEEMLLHDARLIADALAP